MSRKSGQNLLLFVHSSIDDANLTPGAFRVLGNLTRRAGCKGEAYPSITAIAKTCRMKRHSVIKAIHELEKSCFISAVRKPGKTTVYYLSPKVKPRPGVVEPVIDETTTAEATSSAHLGTGQRTASSGYLGTTPVPSQALHQYPSKPADQVTEPPEVAEGSPFKDIQLRGSIIKGAKAPKKYPPLDDFIFREDGEEEGGNEGKEASELRPADNAAQPSSSVTNSKHRKEAARTTRSRPANRKPGSALTGMPSLEQIRLETRALNLPDSDADQLHDYWLGNGYRTGQNQVHDWKAVIRSWHRGKLFPSQKKFETFERMRARARQEEELEYIKRAAARAREAGQ